MRLLFDSKTTMTTTDKRLASEDVFGCLAGLILDLDAAKGVEFDASNKVLSWNNQVIGARAQAFKPNPIGRSDPEAGIPTRLDPAISSGEHTTIQFNRQELINDDEAAFDHLIQGNGYTWLAVIAVYEQTSPVKNTHAFFGNLRNTTAFEGQGTGGHYEGFWGVVHDDRHVYAGTRNGIDFERNGPNNPEVLSETVLEKNRLYVVAGRMGAGTGEVKLEVFVNTAEAERSAMVPINPQANPSKMAVGQERDATDHPGCESFEGELARLLIYERPLSNDELSEAMLQLCETYNIRRL